MQIAAAFDHLSAERLRAKPRARLDALLVGAWRRGWSPEPVLDPETLVAAAMRRTRLDDFGPTDAWQTRLRLLTRSLAADAALSPLGQTIAYGQLVSALSDRLRAHALWRRHPEIAEQPLAPPVIVLGQMRSGTTRVQRLLAQDPQFTFTRFWEAWNPVPGRRGLDDRVVRGAAGLAAARLLNPDFDVIHPTSLWAPDEELGFHSLSLYGSTFEAQWRVPAFAAHCEGADTRPVYTEFRRLLQTVAWLRGERGDRPWVLKVPQFTQDPVSVLAAFPGARLLLLDRALPDLVASSASLVRNQMALQTEALDPRWIGREWLRKTRLRRARVAEALATTRAPSFRLSFDAVNRDPLSQMRSVYEFLDRPLARGVEARMRRYLDRASRGAHRRHRYSLDEFGLSAADLAEPAVLAPDRGSPHIAPERTEAGTAA